jgi:hypothetical protein
MADVSYTPTFHHTDWLDRLDRVEAGGPNGFNVRFRAIEHDLRGLTTVVATIAAKLNQIHTPPAPTPGQDRRLSFTPRLNIVVDGDDPFPWSPDQLGQMTGRAEGPTRSHGLLNLALPDRARLTTIGFRATITGPAGGAPVLVVTLYRVALQLTAQPSTRELVGTVSTGDANANVVRTITSGDNATVDLANFRYLIEVTLNNETLVEQSATLINVTLTYQPA